MDFKEEMKVTLALLQRTQSTFKELQPNKISAIAPYLDLINVVQIEYEKSENRMQKKAALIEELRQVEKDLRNRLNMLKEDGRKQNTKKLKIDSRVKKFEDSVLKYDLWKIITKTGFDLESDNLVGYVKHDKNIRFFDIKKDENEDVIANKLWKNVTEVVNNSQ